MPQTLPHTLRVRLPAWPLVLALAGAALLLIAPAANAQPKSAWRLLRVTVDNAGSLTATPATVVGGSSGNTLTLTYSADMRIQKAAVKISVPAGWSAPSKSGVAPGYVTASAGTVSIADRTILVSGFNFGQKGGRIVVTFGSKAGGGPGAASPAIATTQVWQGSARGTRNRLPQRRPRTEGPTRSRETSERWA